MRKFSQKLTRSDGNQDVWAVRKYELCSDSKCDTRFVCARAGSKRMPNSRLFWRHFRFAYCLDEITWVTDDRCWPITKSRVYCKYGLPCASQEVLQPNARSRWQFSCWKHDRYSKPNGEIRTPKKLNSNAKCVRSKVGTSDRSLISRGDVTRSMHASTLLRYENQRSNSLLYFSLEGYGFWNALLANNGAPVSSQPKSFYLFAVNLVDRHPVNVFK